MKWFTQGKNTFISAVVPHFRFRTTEQKPFQRPKSVTHRRDALPLRSPYALVNRTLSAHGPMTSNTSSIPFASAASLPPVGVQVDASGNKMLSGSLPKCQVIGSPITALPFDAQMDIIANWAKSRLSKMVCVANAHMLVEAHWNDAFAAVLKKADLVTSDGMPIVWMMKLLGFRTQNRVAGMDILLALCHLSIRSNLKVFFLGCERSILDRMQDRLNCDFPGLKVVGMEPLPFRPMTAAEEEDILAMIEASGANLVFVSLGCPKQEYWMAKHRDRIQAVMLGLGGAFPVYAGVKKWAPRWMRDAGLEWAYRLLQEPRRLAGRYGKTNQVFLWLAFKQFLRIGFERFSRRSAGAFSSRP
jgi:N-acetylglucosaminyldiphosphoundecaprenol N-acetyl-beta-D-mannosaminyltransferase